MSGRMIAYGRVSTKEQKLDRQLIAFHELGIKPEHIFIEKQSGKDFNRPIYKKLLKFLKKGDTLVIKSIDRLGRNYEEIIEEWRYLTREKEVNLRVIDTPVINTSLDRDLMGTVFADIILQLQSAFAQAERDNIKQRQAEGIAAARNRGVKFGPKPTPLTKKFQVLKKEWKMGNISAREAGRRLGICHKTFLKWVKR